jgi:hypothetical protein
MVERADATHLPFTLVGTLGLLTLGALLLGLAEH